MAADVEQAQRPLLERLERQSEQIGEFRKEVEQR
jgi:hypothetical protein